MTISILICTRNRADSLAQTLQSLAKLRIPPAWSAELLIVDNGSTDHTSEVIRDAVPGDLTVRWVFEPQAGLSRARNHGLGEAAGDIILFTDDDVRVPSHWLEGMCRPIVDDEADCVAGPVRLSEELVQPWHTEVLNTWFVSGSPPPGDLWGANMAFHRRVLDRVPNFDQELGAGALGFGEDSLFAMQIEKAGFRMVQVPVELLHFPDPARFDEANLVKAAAKRGSSAAYIAHHWELKTERFLTLRIAARSAKMALRLLFSRADGSVPRLWLVFNTWRISYLRQIRKLRGTRPVGQVSSLPESSPARKFAQPQ